MSSSRLHRTVVHTGTQRGFTLIEVLVVVAIIALLVSVLMPALGAAKRQARVVVCATSLKTIGLGTQFYAQASKDDLPAGYEINPATGRPMLDINHNTTLALQPWEFLYTYVQKVNMKQGTIAGETSTDGMIMSVPVYSCPEDVKQHTSSERPINGKKVMMAMSYGANLLPMFKDSVSAVSFTNSNDSVQKSAYLTRGAGKFSTIKTPGAIVSYYDNGDDGDSIKTFRKNDAPRARWYLYDCKAQYGVNQCTFEARHKTGGNFAFMDGHVAYQSINYTAPFYGLPHFPTAWLPDYNPSTWPTSAQNAEVGWVKDWHAGNKAFLAPTSVGPPPPL